MKSVTALVPIKGESERVPGKNLRNFCGRPLLDRVLEVLQETKHIQRIIVNTDSASIAKLAQNFTKVCIHQRPLHLVGHTVPMNLVLASDLKLLGEGHYLQTHVTNPMLTSTTVTKALQVYFSKLPECDSLFSVTRHQSRFFSADGQPLNHNPTILLNTQDLPPLLEENSCIYIFSYDSFFANKENRIGRKPHLYPMPKLESLDIDTEDDFHLAEVAWRAFRTRHSISTNIDIE